MWKKEGEGVPRDSVAMQRRIDAEGSSLSNLAAVRSAARFVRASRNVRGHGPI